MATVKQRLNKLEAETQGDGRCIVVRTGPGHTDGDVQACLQRCGITRGALDLIVVLRTTFENRNGTDAPDLEPPEMLSISPIRSR